jgi:arabinosaccharide transport system substrate-binding protein
MLDRFPYGKAPLCLLVIAIVATGLRVLAVGGRPKRADLVLVTLSAYHYEAYQKAIRDFERSRGITVRLQYANATSLQSRLQNAMLAGTEVPDMAELVENSLSFFARGPRRDIGLLDLTERLEKSGLDKRLVASRLSLWSSEGRVYALPHDVHPVMLAYRRDLVENLGIDVTQLDTWDKFVDVGRRVTRDTDGDGTIDQYMIDLSYDGSWSLDALLLQRGAQLFDERGKVAFNSDVTVEVFEWLLRQSFGPHKIAYDPDASGASGQSLLKAMTDGLVLFVWTPDWRSRIFQDDAPHLAGKMGLMPLPAWQPGGRRTTVWGGTGLIISKSTRHPDWAWDLANFLYFDPKEIGARYAGTNIIPVLKDAWGLPELDAPNPYYSNQPIGRMYADLAPSTPSRNLTPLSFVAEQKLYEAYSRCIEYYRRYGEEGLSQEIRGELGRAEAYVKLRSDRVAALARAD